MSFLSRLKEVILGDGAHSDAMSNSFEEAAARVIQSSRELNRTFNEGITKHRKDIDDFEKFVVNMRTAGMQKAAPNGAAKPAPKPKPRAKRGTTNVRKTRKRPASE